MNLLVHFRKLVFMILAGLVLLTACKEDNTTQERTEEELRYLDLYIASRYPDAALKEDGLYYLEHKAGTGASPGEEDWLMVNHVGYEVPEDKVFVSYIENVAKDNGLDPNSVGLYGPYKLQNGSVNEGFTRGVRLMKEGGQATLIFPSALGYGSSGNSSIKPYKSLKYEIELLEVIPDIELYEEAKIDAYMDTVASFNTILDEGTGAVMYYMVDHSTDGQAIVDDSAVSLAYTGMLLDGRVFDSKDADDPYKFTMGQAEHIVGWDLGLPRLKEGETARLLIPYPLAYGIIGSTDPSTGLRTIPPYETLLFYIEVLSVGASADDDDKLPGAE